MVSVAGYQIDQISALEKLNVSQIESLGDLIIDVSSNMGRIWIAGNGGSATTASHLATDLSKGCFVNSKQKFPSICLNELLGNQTAWANDFSFESAIANELEAHSLKGDIFIGISGSGNSKNILQALHFANNYGLSSVALTGMGGGKILGVAKNEIIVSSYDMQIIENTHLYIVHYLYKYISEKTSQKA